MDLDLNHPARPTITFLPPPRTARGRTLRTWAAIGVAGLLVVVSLVAMANGVVLGVLGLLCGVLVIEALIYTVNELKDLRAVGHVRIGDLSHHIPVVHMGLTCGDVRRRAAELLADEWCLVESRDGWRVAHSTAVIEAALALDDRVAMPPIGRHARIIDASLMADDLPRPPRQDEVWLVGDSQDPLALTRDDLRTASTSG